MFDSCSCVVLIQGRNALILASWNGQLEVTRYLLAHGVDPDVKDEDVRDDKNVSLSRTYTLIVC